MQTRTKWFLGALGAAVVLGAGLAPKPTPEQESARKAASEQDAKRGLIIGFAAKSLRESMRNPPSLVWESAFSSNDASVVCFRYRAQNGFGGMAREAAVFHSGVISHEAKEINKLCHAAVIDAMWDVKYSEENHFLVPAR